MNSKSKPLNLPANKTAVVFTLDQDWAPDHIMETVLSIFVEASIPVTVFATGPSAVLKNPPRNVAVGIHPNLLNVEKRSHSRVVADLLDAYPSAKGVRSHGLFEYSDLMRIYRELGIEWDSSQLLYMCHGIRPYRHPSGLARLPIYWEDDDYLEMNPEWKASKILSGRSGIKCLDLHPVHIALNSQSLSCYKKLKKSGFSREAAFKFMYKGKKRGVRVLLEELIGYVMRNNIKVAQIGEVCAWA